MAINYIQSEFHKLRRKGKHEQACFLASRFSKAFCFNKDEIITVFVSNDFTQQECELYLEEIWHAKF